MTCVPDFRNPPKTRDHWYDPDHDAVLIEQSIAKQYGVIPSMQGDLKYSDWAKMVSGLMEDTPLGRIVQIRAETDRDAIKRFTPDQRQIWQAWQRFRTERIMANPDARAEYRNQMRALERSFAVAFGGKGGG